LIRINHAVGEKAYLERIHSMERSMLGFLPLAVVGPIVGPKFGLGRACVDCVESREGRIACHGFGPGCLGARPLPALSSPYSASSRINR